MHDGWEKSGSVGQEVYGAGLPFGIITRQYVRVPDQDFLIFTDYPTTDVNVQKGKSVSFNIKGDPALACSLRIIPQGGSKLPDIKVAFGKHKKQEAEAFETHEGHLEFKLNGGTPVRVSWNEK
jgi:hypothetical protein